jgi:hippurate hydrolase
MTDIDSLVADMTGWRRDLHRHPEFGFEERRTSGLVARILSRFGAEVTEGVGGTGVVGTLRRGRSNRAIGLRADMDALRITEASDANWASATPGLMHACGHDGHTAMLLGAVCLLADDATFDGTVHFIFQPAEEWGRGAQAMLDDGLFSRFPCDEVYGLHNMPGMPLGHAATRVGPLMAAEDVFEITLTGQGGHAARPHATREVMVPACALVLDLQTIVSRKIDPAEIAVLSITEFETDGTRNALPGRAVIRGDARSYRAEISEQIETNMLRLAEGRARQHGIEAQVSYSREFVPLVNDAVAANALTNAARAVSQDVDSATPPIAASEDFARFLHHVPGAFGFIGNGEASAPLHSPQYDFNDAALIHGAKLYAEIARQRLARAPE